MEETITVTADAPLIETSNASTGDVLDNATLQALPSISRMAYLVSNTLPTVTYTGNPNMNRMQDQTEASKISLGGGPSTGNNYLLDGFPITDLQSRASANPSIEMLQDVKVQIHTYDAEMGRTGGGVFNASARSGIQRVPRIGLRPDAAGRAHRTELLPEVAGPAQSRSVLAQRRRRRSAGRSFRARPSSGLPPRATATA